MGALEDINEKLERLEKNESGKKFSMPWKVFFSRRKLLRKEYCIVLYIRTNGNTSIEILPIEDDTVKFNDKIYAACSRYTLRYKRYPLLIIKEFDTIPVHPDDDIVNLDEEFKKAELLGTLATPGKLIYTRMSMEQIKPKIKLNAKVILIVIVLAVVGYGVFKYFSGGGA
jgi:hypothetical protein